MSRDEKDRRRATRFTAEVPTAAVTPDNPEALPAVGEVVNISGAGMFFNLDRQLEVGTVLSMVFTLPAQLLGREQDTVLWCRARVVRVVESEAGGASFGAEIEELIFLPE